jgi:hypothetical protein
MAEERRIRMLKLAKEIALSRGGLCLSDCYINTDKKLDWQCEEGHKWSAKLNHIKDSGSWCRLCSARRPELLKDAKRHAVKHGGECLSDKYVVGTEHLLWRCASGHEWSATFRNVVYLEHWCHYCSGQLNNSLEVAQELAAKRGGACLSEKYLNVNDHLEWCCAAGHKWSATLNAVKNGGTWCPVCFGRYDHLPRMIEHAEARGGQCLATEYKDAKTKVSWECAVGHQWEAATDNVLNAGSWCPYCRWKSEDEVRSWFEEPTGEKFPKVRGVLESSRLELDGYCAKLRIAFEFQGIQHYQYVPHFHRGGDADLLRQQGRDETKREQCDDAWIVLIEVAYNEINARERIKKELGHLGVLK